MLFSMFVGWGVFLCGNLHDNKIDGVIVKRKSVEWVHSVLTMMNRHVIL